MANMMCEVERLNVFMQSKSFEDVCTDTEYWMKTKYTVSPFTDDLKNLIKKPNCKISKKKLDLPPKNEFIPKNFDLLPKDEKLSAKPILLKQWDNVDLWFKKDDKFEMPKAIF